MTEKCVCACCWKFRWAGWPFIVLESATAWCVCSYRFTAACSHNEQCTSKSNNSYMHHQQISLVHKRCEYKHKIAALSTHAHTHTHIFSFWPTFALDVIFENVKFRNLHTIGHIWWLLKHFKYHFKLKNICVNHYKNKSLKQAWLKRKSGYEYKTIGFWSHKFKLLEA